MHCPFCTVDDSRVFYRGELIIGLWDAYPVSPGHALLVPLRSGALGPEAEARIAQGSPEELEGWLERVITAVTLDAVFAD